MVFTAAERRIFRVNYSKPRDAFSLQAVHLSNQLISEYILGTQPKQVFQVNVLNKAQLLFY